MQVFRLKALAVALLAAAAVAAQERRDLELVHVFGLEPHLTPPYDEPLDWLDDERYLVFGAVEVEGHEVPVFFAVTAASGAREVFLPPTWRDDFLAVPGMRAEVLAESLSDPESFVWNPDHSGFLADLAGDLFFWKAGEVRRLTHSPTPEVGVRFSPDGRLVAFVADHDLWVVPVTGGTPRALTDGGHEDLFFGRLDWVYQEELYGRGNFQGYWWSPDSTRIALLRLDESPVREFTLVSDVPVRPDVEVENYPKAGEPNPEVTLGVVDVAGGDVRWFDMSRYGTTDTLIVRVTWHPSGDEVFFQVQDREQRWLEMLAGHTETGAVRLVFREESPCWIEAGPEPWFVNGGEAFLWASERDGFEHLYRYSRSGNLLGRLTEGEYDVEKVLAVDEAQDRVWFLSDRGDWKQQNLFSVPLSGGEPQRLTERDGWHEVELSKGNLRFVDTYSSAAYPKAVWVRDAATGEALRTVVESREQVLAMFGIERPEFVTVPNRDGFEMEGMLLRPRDFDPARRYPCLQFTYSGPHTPRVLDEWRWRDFLWHTRMAQQGYVVFVVDNRSASGKGRVSACTAWRRLGQTELQDLEDALDWLLAQEFVDPTRVALWGWSYGGYQTLYNLTRSKKWAAGIAVNPVTDWRLYDTIYTERYMGLPQTNPRGYADANVLEKARDLHGELLLVHATMDDNVHMQNSFQLVHALQEAGKLFRFMPYPRVRHGIADLEQQLHLFRTMEAFLAETIGGGSAR